MFGTIESQSIKTEQNKCNSSITEQEHQKFYLNPQLLKMYENIKLHKFNKCIRPVVS